MIMQWILIAYPIDMPQCLEADSPAFSNNDRPTNDTVGTIVSGVTYLTILPIRPESNSYNYF